MRVEVTPVDNPATGADPGDLGEADHSVAVAFNGDATVNLGKKEGCVLVLGDEIAGVVDGRGSGISGGDGPLRDADEIQLGGNASCEGVVGRVAGDLRKEAAGGTLGVIVVLIVEGGLKGCAG